MDALSVVVKPAPRRWRALLVGEQNYAPGVADVRLGSANSVAGVRSMLGALSYLGTRFEVSTALDLAADELPGLLDSVQELGKSFLHRRMAGAACTGVEFDPLYSPSHLREKGLFVSIIELTFRTAG